MTASDLDSAHAGSDVEQAGDVAGEELFGRVRRVRWCTRFVLLVMLFAAPLRPIGFDALRIEPREDLIESLRASVESYDGQLIQCGRRIEIGVYVRLFMCGAERVQHVCAVGDEQLAPVERVAELAAEHRQVERAPC